MTTEQDNELIMQYLGWEKSKGQVPENWYLVPEEWASENPNITHNWTTGSKFRTSWDWAMLLYEKITDWYDEHQIDVPAGITEALCNPDIEEFVEMMVRDIKQRMEDGCK